MKRGRRQGMDEIYKENAKIVSHFIYSICKDDKLTEDLTQETFLQAYKSLERFDGSCKLSTWLCQIAKHLLYQYWNKKGKQDSIPIDEQLVSECNTEQQVFNRVELLDVLHDLHNLPEQMREVVYLRALGDLSYKEIGEIMGKSENWARVNFYRAKEALLKEKLKKDGEAYGKGGL